MGRAPARTFTLHGYAIVSLDDAIAISGNSFPPQLRHSADWNYFQDQLDGAELVLVGSRAHAAFPSPAHRARLVLTSRVGGLVQDMASKGRVHRLNPFCLPLGQALARLVSPGARVAVAGGAQVMAAALALGFDSFHLTRAEGVMLPQGIKLFSAVESGGTAKAASRAHDILMAHGLTDVTHSSLAPNLTLNVYERPLAEPS